LLDHCHILLLDITNKKPLYLQTAVLNFALHPPMMKRILGGWSYYLTDTSEAVVGVTRRRSLQFGGSVEGTIH
jgi:hypothetical protein